MSSIPAETRSAHSLDIYSPPPFPAVQTRPTDRSNGAPAQTNYVESTGVLFTSAQPNPSHDTQDSNDPTAAGNSQSAQPGFTSVISRLRSYYGEGDDDGAEDHPSAFVVRAPSAATRPSRQPSLKGIPGIRGASEELLAVEGGGVVCDDDIWDLEPGWKKFLVQFNVSHFGVAMGTSAHMALWRALSNSVEWLRIPREIWYVLWFMSVLVFTVEVILYTIRCFVFPNGLRRDFYNNRFVNFFMAPVIVLTSVLSSVPPFLSSTGRTETVLTYFLIAYQLLFAVYLYGDWLFWKEFSLHKIDPTYQMAVIGFFLVSRVASEQRDTSAATFNLSVGLLFWFVVFTALFLNVAVSFRARSISPSPTMFLFLAPPAAASLAVTALHTARGNGDEPFTDLAVFFVMVDGFVFLLLLRLLPVWVFQRFNIAWWAYIFPLSTAAIAFVGYAVAVDIMFWKVVGGVTSAVAVVVTVAVAGLTVVKFARRRLPFDEKARLLYCRCVRCRVLGVDSDGEVGDDGQSR